MQLGLAHNIGSARGSGCKARGAVQAVQRRRRPSAQIRRQGQIQWLRSSKVPCQPFGTGQISPHAALYSALLRLALWGRRVRGVQVGFLPT
jgi:hypothetical protein